MAFFATSPKGTEPALRDELLELGFRGVRADRGGVHFDGELLEGQRACLLSRIAMRVLLPLSTFPAGAERPLYEGVRELDLDPVLRPEQTFVVGATSRASRLTHTEYLCQLTKDAIVDRIRDRHGRRPSVDKRDADVRLFLHLAKDVATVYLDLAGAALNRRGFRERDAEAPLKETLAAALLRYSGWDRRSPLVDPLCGSGTLLVEAALWARNVAPGLSRQRFGFERWANYDPPARAAFEALKVEARAAARPDHPPLLGRDASERSLGLVRALAAREGFRFDLAALDLRDAEFEGAGAIVGNPPYGERLARPAELARTLGRLVDRHPNAHVALIMAEQQPIARTRRRPQLRSVFNGDIPCVIRSWEAL